MKLLSRIALLLGLSLTSAWAYPPAPAHEIYGVVRNSSGRPLNAGEGTMILEGNGIEISRAPTDPLTLDGTNYRLNVPMDSGLFAGLYQPNALTQNVPFTIRVVILGISHVPIQMVGNIWQIGTPGGRTRIDLTLGVDSDGDGLPDEWEQLMIDSDVTGRLLSLADVTAEGDLDGDGLTNLQEFLLGTYPLDFADGLRLDIVGVSGGMAHMQFVCVSGRTYKIRSSSNLTIWNPTTFAQGTPAGAQLDKLRADETTILDIYAPIGSATVLSFRLYAE